VTAPRWIAAGTGVSGGGPVLLSESASHYPLFLFGPVVSPLGNFSVSASVRSIRDVKNRGGVAGRSAEGRAGGPIAGRLPVTDADPNESPTLRTEEKVTIQTSARPLLPRPPQPAASVTGFGQSSRPAIESLVTCWGCARWRARDADQMVVIDPS
jgi:hypothetical protein